MKITHSLPAIVLLATFAIVGCTEIPVTPPIVIQAPATVDLASAGNFVILAQTAITNTGSSIMVGNLGLSPAASTSITGLNLMGKSTHANSALVTGNIYAADMSKPTQDTLDTAISDMIAAYTEAAQRPSPNFAELGAGNIGGKVLTTGLYNWTTAVTIPADVTFSGGADDIWIFQIGGDLTSASAVNVILTGGARAQNIFWQVAGRTTLGANSHFEGNILSLSNITFLTKATLYGSALSQSEVILDSNELTRVQEQ